MPHSIPWKFWLHTTHQILQINRIPDAILSGTSEQVENLQFYFTKSKPKTLNWIETYNQDPGIFFMFTMFTKTSKVKWLLYQYTVIYPYTATTYTPLHCYTSIPLHHYTIILIHLYTVTILSYYTAKALHFYTATPLDW